MSYDIRIAEETFNITYNVAPMFYKYNKEGVRCIYGKTGAQAATLLLDMYSYFIESKEELEKMNPENGWGSWKNTTNCIHKMMMTSLDNPKDIWEGD